MGKKKVLCGNNFSSFSYVNMELLLNMLRHKINLYKNEQEQCYRKHLLQIENNQGFSQ